MPPDDPTPTPEPEGRPDWLPEQFQTPEALADAYAESRKEMNRLQTDSQREREAFASALEGMQQQPQQTMPQQQQAFDPAVSAYTQAWENGDVQGMLEAQAQYNLKATLPAVAEVLKQELGSLGPQVQAAQLAQREHDLRMAEGLVERQLGPDRYQEVMPRVKEIINNDVQRWLPQGSSVETYAASILDVVRFADYDRLEKLEQDVAKERQDKIAAQTLTGGYNRQSVNPDVAKAEFDRIKNTQSGTFEELMQRSRGA